MIDQLYHKYKVFNYVLNYFVKNMLSSPDAYTTQFYLEIIFLVSS